MEFLRALSLSMLEEQKGDNELLSIDAHDQQRCA